MPDSKYINAQWCAEEATNLVMKLQNEGKGDRELLRAVALLATAIIKLGIAPRRAELNCSRHHRSGRHWGVARAAGPPE
jgi:hypothetical protein